MQTVQMTLGEIGVNEISRIAQNFQLRKNNVEGAIQLLLEGKTPSFIARYRRAKTAGMNELTLRAIRERLFKIRAFLERKETILKAIETLGKLSPELRQQIQALESPKHLEDFYLPFKPKKNTLAASAREKGLEAFADALWAEDPAIDNLPEILPTMINPEKGLENIEKINEGVVQIFAEKLAESPSVRASVRDDLWGHGKIKVTKTARVKEKYGIEFKEYFSYEEPLKTLQARKYLQIAKGEKSGFLNILFDWDFSKAKKNALDSLASKTIIFQAHGAENFEPHSTDAHDSELPENQESQLSPVAEQVLAAPVQLQTPAKPSFQHKYLELISKAMDLAFDQILKSFMEKECQRDLAEKSSEHAATLLARFFHNRLVADPAGPIKVLAIDPGFRNGCRIVVLNEEGSHIDHAVIFPHQPQGKKELSLLILEQLIRKHQVQTIALGNGNAAKATEVLLYELLERLKNPLHLEDEKKEVLLSEESMELTETVNVEPLAEVGKAFVAIIVPESPAIETVAVETPAIETVVTETVTEPVTVVEGVQEVAPVEPATPVVTGPSPEVLAAKKKLELEAQKKLEKERRQAEYQKLVQDAKIMVKGLPSPPSEVRFASVIEAGAAEYASSSLGKEELPEIDNAMRTAVSLGRRLQNPLRELIKIDPIYVVSGLLDFEVQHRYLRPALENVLESCVNAVGADLNKVEASYLQNISGLNPLLAQEIVGYRKKNGPFKNKKQLLEIPNFSPEKFELCAGFLQVYDGDEPFDATNFHTDDYEMAGKILVGFDIAKDDWKKPEKKDELLQKARAANLKEVVAATGIDSVTSLKDFLDELIHPLSQSQARRFGPVYRTKQHHFDELQVGMELVGVVQNVVEFGCFVDVGIKESGLVHISQISARYVRSPYESVSVGDIVKVWVIALDKEKSRISLSMIRPARQDYNSNRAPRERPQRRVDPRNQDQGSQNAANSSDPRGPRENEQRPRNPERPSDRPLDRNASRPPAARSNSGSSFRPRDDKPRGARPPRPDANRPPQIRTFSSPKPVTKPNLSQSALSGDSPLGTFAELAVFWEKKPAGDGTEADSSNAGPENNAGLKQNEGNTNPE